MFSKIPNKFILLLFFSVLFFSGLSAQTKKNFTLIMRNTGTYTLWDSTIINTYGFAKKLSDPINIPGPTITVNEGDSVEIEGWNVSQGEPHTIHLHGLDVDQANDGVGHLSFDIDHMGKGYYKFLAKNAGTYLYHCHVTSIVHVQMGMYGLLVVKAANDAQTAWTGGPSYHKEYSWILSEIDKEWHDSIPPHNMDDSLHIMPVYVPEYSPDYFLINGKSEFQLSDSTISISGSVNEKIYLRLANVGFFENRIIFPGTLKMEIIDSDGRPLPAAIRTDTILFSPGERYGVMLSPSAEIIDSIYTDYINMNTAAVWKRESIPVAIAGYLGLQESALNKLSFKIFPNPANKTVNINVSATHAEPGLLCLVNFLGEVVRQQKITITKNNAIEVDLADLKQGVYFFQLNTGSQLLQEKLVIVN